MRKIVSAALAVLLLAAAPAGADPPGFNVHEVTTVHGHTMWRGGAPTPETMKALAKAAKTDGAVTIFDLRHPDNSDDNSGKGGRLSPSGEAKMAQQYGLRYVSVSALGKNLPEQIDAALKKGDVYIHCMYGVNRTGFACGRLATRDHLTIERKGIGARDYDQGAAFEKKQGP
jgi:hypothetical protein